METKGGKQKDVEDTRDLQKVGETDKEPAAPIYSKTLCKMGKDWDFSWHYLYQCFAKKYYSNLTFNKGYEDQAIYVYHKIS